jgi:DNA repair exonuclease SbcCD nuclease subunit
MNFIHVSDLHLGYAQYGLDERFRDYARAFQSVIRYAIDNKAEFVVISGDLFHKRNINAPTYLQAYKVLSELREKSPSTQVFAIEGNHDLAYSQDGKSWSEILNSQGLLRLLRTKEADGVSLMGDVIELDNVRIFGVKYLGSSTVSTIPRIAEEIRKIRELRGAKYTILMMHFGLEGQVKQASAGEIPYSSLLVLKDVVNYLALGHYHMNYECDGWIFNPGSVEMVSMSEHGLPKGFYHVSDSGAKLVTPPIRPVRRISLDMSSIASPDELYSRIRGIENEPALPPGALVELSLYGAMGFQKSDVDLERVKGIISERFNPLWSEVRIAKTSARYTVTEGDLRGLTREQIEYFVFSGMVGSDSRYKDHTKEVVSNILEVKKKVSAKLGDEDIQKELRCGFERIESGVNKV